MARTGAEPRLGRRSHRVSLTHAFTDPPHHHARRAPLRRRTGLHACEWWPRRSWSDHGADGRANGRIGIELEWITRADDTPSARPTTSAAIGDELPERSRITFEPGGQLELSGPAHRDADSAICAMHVDVLERAARSPPTASTSWVSVSIRPGCATE
jgi:hypothetical protein